MRILLGVFCVLTSCQLSMAAIVTTNDYATAVTEAVWKGVTKCGLVREEAAAPWLPTPRVPAMEAVVSRSRGVLAYSNQFFLPVPPMATTEFKNPDGGQNHNVTYNAGFIAFNTPTGTVASAQRTASTGPIRYNYLCNGHPVLNGQAFDACVQRFYVGSIVGQLCR